MRKEQVIVRRIHSERVGVLIYKATGAKPEECKHPRGKKKDHLHKHTNDNVEILEPFLLGLMNQIVRQIQETALDSLFMTKLRSGCSVYFVSCPASGTHRPSHLFIYLDIVKKCLILNLILHDHICETLVLPAVC